MEQHKGFFSCVGYLTFNFQMLNIDKVLIQLLSNRGRMKCSIMKRVEGNAKEPKFKRILKEGA